MSQETDRRSSREGLYFGIQALDRIHHGAYSSWVKAGISAAAGGYALVTALGVFIRGFSPITMLTQGATVGVCLVALWLAFRNRLQVAATLTIGAIWFELQTGLLNGGMAISSIMVLPTVIVGAGLLWGGRGAYALAGATAITVPGLALVGHRLLGAPSSDIEYEIYLLVILIAVMFFTAALLDLSMRALGSVVASSLVSARRVAELVRPTPEGILALDEGGAILSANPAAERLLGGREEDLIGRSVIAALGVRLRHQEASDLERRLLDAFEPVALEFSTEEGSTIIINATTTRYERRDGSEGLRLTLHDATARVRAEEQERATQARLEETNRLDSVGRLAGGVAHDFNNHLTVIGGSAEIILSGAGADTEELASSILRAKIRAAMLTKSLLAFARRQMISPRELEIHEVVSDCEPLLKSLVGDGVRLEIVADHTPMVMADRNQIEQCLVNLLANAKDALAGGGVASVHTASPGDTSQSVFGEVQTVPQGFVELRVEDQGPGMDETTMHRALGPFFTTSPFGERAGLGLSMVHGVVSQNGGQVLLESREGRGDVRPHSVAGPPWCLSTNSRDAPDSLTF